MYENAIRRVNELVNGPQQYAVGLAISQAAREAGITSLALSRAMRARLTAKQAAEKARETYRNTVPDRMLKDWEKR